MRGTFEEGEKAVIRKRKKKLRKIKIHLRQALDLNLPEHFEHVLPRDVEEAVRNLEKHGFSVNVILDIAKNIPEQNLSDRDRQYLTNLADALAMARGE